ncbi:hypothetical protein [Ulvibacterium sp.]|uniref:hypothetical protein n=1 Tax=Ulvibacterium sp. TaxID=2665914 RepID=UPI003BAB5039
MIKSLLIPLLWLSAISIMAQTDTPVKVKKERLDFAKGYFELGGTYFPSFTGKRLDNDQTVSFKNSESLHSTLYWGAFHFWGKAEFYVSFPLGKLNLQKSDITDADFKHFAVTGARFYPWAIEEKKVRPFVGLSWSALEFTQIITDNDILPQFEKNIELGFDAGLVYNYKDFALRLSVNYLPNNEWSYPISKTRFETIKTPDYGINLGLLYTTDFSKQNGNPRLNEKWNEYPTVSSLGYDSVTFGDVFVGIGPSISFSLESAKYNRNNFAYLNDKEASQSYFDIALGYQFNNWNMFSTISFRNPRFIREGFETKQTVRKTSFVLEVNKFLTDYSGFAPYVGANLAYDTINYEEKERDIIQKKLTFRSLEPGLTIGWDIVPGKTSEALILRTNLRWYPFSSFEVEGQKFNFSQLEYNLIQVLFYPERLLRSKKGKLF